MWKQLSLCAGLGAILVAACATTPKTPAKRQALVDDAQAALSEVRAKDPSLHDAIERAHAYAVFPTVGKAGAVAGGAYGRGIVYEGGSHVGFAELNQVSIGAQLGAQTFTEVLVFRDAQALEKFKRGGLEITAAASAVLITAGAGRSFDFSDDGIAVLILPKGGAMVELSVAGQEFNYQPRRI